MDEPTQACYVIHTVLVNVMKITFKILHLLHCALMQPQPEEVSMLVL